MGQIPQGSNYDHIAGIYDRLAALVFGSSIIRSQLWLLQYQLAGSRIIIAGGGTGVLLEALGKMDIPSLDITFVELSGKMMRKAQKRNTGKHKIQFVHNAIEQFIADHPFDVIITPFLFDNFASNKATEVFGHLNGMLRPGGTWLFTDFDLYHEAPWWQRILLQFMYGFFKIIARVTANTLPDMDSRFVTAGYSCEQEHFFYKRFIRSALYRKPSQPES